MVSAIIVSAGKGTRMESSHRKQYLLLKGYPILFHTIKAIDFSRKVDEIVLVIPENDFVFCRENIVEAVNPAKKIHLVSGGNKRQSSVYRGLKKIDDKSKIVVIHDGVRPFIRPEQVDACVKGAEESGGCILGIPAYDTLKIVDQSCWINKTIQRDTVWMAQTPQAFKYSLIRKAHEKAVAEGFTGTDDASLVERMGQKVRIIMGSKQNIKITTKEDLVLARMFIDEKNFSSDLSGS